MRKASREEFWALKDVSFEVEEGEVIGIVGRNGAGKSTLLKVLSRITEPTEGCVTLKGRIASLLEVGTGFHQELTGRENIFLNGAILGMSRAEIRRKFDEIVAFSEIEKFLDTPVKRYSSGMYVRLAFAVAAHLEPEILVVDEVLAVGDAEFQKKCLGKMESAGSQGRTVLFVSHNMGVVRRLCRKSVLLEQGRLVAFGDTDEVISKYLSKGCEAYGFRTWPENSADEKLVRLCEIRVVTSEQEVSGHVDIRQPFSIEVKYRILSRLPMSRIALRLFTAEGILAFTAADSSSPDFSKKSNEPGLYVCRCTIPGNLLNEGQYYVTVTGDIPFQEILFSEESAIGFCVEQTGGASSRFPEKWGGAVCPLLEWSTERAEDELVLPGAR
ncbi:MAG TPA: ABC transporter ATP-binding protein [Candidatus Acidoferrum sp.]|nr:ABC transporter ATP-binding protein [Candidatus Acidoferrum sp.]